MYQIVVMLGRIPTLMHVFQEEDIEESDIELYAKEFEGF